MWRELKLRLGIAGLVTFLVLYATWRVAHLVGTVAESSVPGYPEYTSFREFNWENTWWVWLIGLGVSAAIGFLIVFWPTRLAAADTSAPSEEDAVELPQERGK